MGINFQKNRLDLQMTFNQVTEKGRIQGHYEHWKSYEGQEHFFENLLPFLVAKLIEN